MAGKTAEHVIVTSTDSSHRFVQLKNGHNRLELIPTPIANP